jgi:hypothetical protein
VSGEFYVPEPPEPLKNVFALTNPGDLLNKLAWEVRELQRSLSPEVDEFPWLLASSYRAFNCAVTALHLADWTWQSSNAEQLEQLAKKFDLKVTGNDQTDITGFCNALAAKSREFQLCRKIGNGSKHMKLRRTADDIVVRAEWVLREGTAESRGRGYVIDLHIEDDGRRISAVAVFVAVRGFWQNLLGELFFIEGRKYFEGGPLQESFGTRRRPHD